MLFAHKTGFMGVHLCRWTVHWAQQISALGLNSAVATLNFRVSFEQVFIHFHFVLCPTNYVTGFAHRLFLVMLSTTPYGRTPHTILQIRKMGLTE
jgi:hypothetical protein